jgi:hypothetical protein
MIRIDTDRTVLEMLTVVSLLELGLGGKVRHGVQLHLRCVKEVLDKWWRRSALKSSRDGRFKDGGR